MPSEREWHAFQYYIPANDSEREAGPDNYTKRVEGDHLLVAGDVAIVIEDKAVALSSVPQRVGLSPAERPHRNHYQGGRTSAAPRCPHSRRPGHPGTG